MGFKESISDSRANLPELMLDSKGICFLCLSQTRGITRQHEGKQISNIWNLRNLSRFLRINLSLSVQEVLSEVGVHYCIERSDAKVQLCSKCNELAIKFGELYEILEQTRLRLNECVGQISHELSRSQNDTGRVEEARNTMIGTEESIKGEDDHAGVTATLRLMNKLRSEVLRKGSLKIKNDSPRVQLNKVKVKVKSKTGLAVAVKTEPETEANWNNYMDANANDADFSMTVAEPKIEVNEYDPMLAASAADPKMEMTDDGEDVDFDMQHSSSDSEYEVRGPPVAKKRKLTLTQPTQPKRLSSCRFCWNMINAKNPRLVELHEIKFHCHEFFRSHRLPHISEENFARIVYHILFKNIQVSFVGLQKGNNTTYSCPYCTKELKRSDKHIKYWMRRHMIKDHYETLTNELMRLQNDPGLKKEKEMEQGLGEICICGCYLGISVTVTYHRLQYKCLERKSGDGQEEPQIVSGSYLKSAKLRESVVSGIPKQALPCRFCSNMINRKSQEYIDLHEMKYHCHELFKDHRLPHINEEMFCKIVHHMLFSNLEIVSTLGKESGYKCPYCPNETSWLRSDAPRSCRKRNFGCMQLHMFKGHFDVLLDRLRKLQNDDVISITEKLKDIETSKRFMGFSCACGCYFATAHSATFHREQKQCYKLTDNNEDFRSQHELSLPEQDPLGFECHELEVKNEAEDCHL